MIPVQNLTAQAPLPPTPPLPPQGTPAATAGAPEAPVTFTQAYVNALKAKRSELSRQLESAQGRRDEAAKDLRNADDGVARTGLEQKLQVLDARLVQLETDIAANGRQLAAAPGNMLGSPSSSESSRPNDGRPFSSGQLTGISIVFTLAVLMPMALAFGRRMLRRPVEVKPSPQLMENTARMERMEQAVDAIAVEIERISEGQRFVTQLLGKRTEAAALPDSVRS